jgi:hypothetical protein
MSGWICKQAKIAVEKRLGTQENSRKTCAQDKTYEKSEPSRSQPNFANKPTIQGNLTNDLP